MRISIRKIATAAALASVVALSGCADYLLLPKAKPASNATQDANLVEASYAAADALMGSVPWLKEERRTLLAASFVNINSLDESSALGRMVSEQVSSRFAQKGFTMVEMKMRNSVFIKERSGEFMLSRSVKELSASHDAAAVIAGTYAVGKRSVYVTARLIRATDNLVLASTDYKLPIGPDTKALLASQ